MSKDDQYEKLIKRAKSRNTEPSVSQYGHKECLQATLSTVIFCGTVVMIYSLLR